TPFTPDFTLLAPDAAAFWLPAAVVPVWAACATTLACCWYAWRCLALEMGLEPVSLAFSAGCFPAAAFCFAALLSSFFFRFFSFLAYRESDTRPASSAPFSTSWALLMPTLSSSYSSILRWTAVRRAAEAYISRFCSLVIREASSTVMSALPNRSCSARSLAFCASLFSLGLRFFSPPRPPGGSRPLVWLSSSTKFSREGLDLSWRCCTLPILRCNLPQLGGHDPVKFQILREVVHKGQNHIAKEKQPFTFTRVGHIGQLMGRNVEL